MKAIFAYTRIQSDKGRDISGIKIELQMYMISLRRWVEIAEGTTDIKGRWRVNYAKTENIVDAPALRIVEAGIPEPRVLAAGGMYSYSPTKKTLRVDFGVIEHLTEFFSLTPSSSSFRRTKHTVVGLYKRQKARQAVVAKTLSDAQTGTIRSTQVESLATTRDSMPPSPATATTTPDLNITELSTTNAGLNVEFMKLKARELELQTRLDKKNILQTQSEKQIKEANARIIILEQNLATRTQEKETLKTKNKNLQQTASRKTNIQDIAYNIGSQIDNANKKMVTENRPYRLGKIDLSLRGVISDDGESMTLVNASDLEKPNAANSLAGVQFELIPESVTKSANTLVRVPDVTSLTETAVRRLLNAVGLRIETANQSMDGNNSIPIGQAIRQSPKSGENAERGETVFVVFTTL